MRFPCEYIASSVLPNLRHRVAKILKERGLSQVAIAKKLGVKQPVIASYLKRPISHNNDGVIDDYLDQLAIEVAEMLYTNQPIQLVLGTVCNSCKKLRVDSVVCAIHRKMVPELSNLVNCSICLDTSSIPSIDKRTAILDNLNAMFEQLKTIKGINIWIPEIGSQLASCDDNAEQFDDIASFPGRIIKVKDEIVSIRPPEFGSSRTMSKLLLWIRRFQKDIKWIISLKNRPELKLKLKKNDILYAETREIDLRWDEVLKNLETHHDINKIRAIVDEGSKGYEAIAYIFGRDSKELFTLINTICQSSIF